MLYKLLLNSCSFNKVQPKDNCFSKGLFLRGENGNVLCKQTYLGHEIPGVCRKKSVEWVLHVKAMTLKIFRITFMP